MYVGLSADPIRISGRPAPIKLPTEVPPATGGGDLVPSWARGLIAVSLVGGALLFMIRMDEEAQKLGGWKAGF